MKHLIIFENFAALKIGDITNQGRIDDITATQAYCNGMWVHHSLVYLVSEPAKEKLKNRGRINPNMVISAFENDIVEKKLEDYTRVMQEEGLSNSFPPIRGYPTILSKSDVRNYRTFLDGSPITKDHVGKYAWITTDGHHRTLAALASGLPSLDTMIDFAYTGDENDYEQ